MEEVNIAEQSSRQQTQSGTTPATNQQARKRHRSSISSTTESPALKRQNTEYLVSLANSLESYTAAITASAMNSQRQREVGIVDIEEAIRNVREVFQLKGAQLAAFAKATDGSMLE